MSDKMSDKEKIFLEKLNQQLSEKKYVTTSMMSSITQIPISTVRRYMTKFCELGILATEGKNRGKKYYIKNI